MKPSCEAATISTSRKRSEDIKTNLCRSHNRDDGSTMDLRTYEVDPRLLDLTPLLDVISAVVDDIDPRNLMRLWMAGI